MAPLAQRHCLRLGSSRSGQLLDEGLDSGAQSAHGHLAADHGGEPVLQISDESKFQLAGTIPRPVRGLSWESSTTISLETGSLRSAPLALYVFKHAMNGRLLEVSKIHRDLRQARTRNPAPLTNR